MLENVQIRVTNRVDGFENLDYLERLPGKTTWKDYLERLHRKTTWKDYLERLHGKTTWKDYED